MLNKKVLGILTAGVLFLSTSGFNALGDSRATLSKIENKVEIHDLHATMLYLLGIDHERLTYRWSGRDMRLTDVHGKVIKDILGVPYKEGPDEDLDAVLEIIEYCKNNPF